MFWKYLLSGTENGFFAKFWANAWKLVVGFRAEELTAAVSGILSLLRLPGGERHHYTHRSYLSTFPKGLTLPLSLTFFHFPNPEVFPTKHSLLVSSLFPGVREQRRIQAFLPSSSSTPGFLSHQGQWATGIRYSKASQVYCKSVHISGGPLKQRPQDWVLSRDFSGSTWIFGVPWPWLKLTHLEMVTQQPRRSLQASRSAWLYSWSYLTSFPPQPEEDWVVLRLQMALSMSVHAHMYICARMFMGGKGWIDQKERSSHWPSCTVIEKAWCWLHRHRQHDPDRPRSHVSKRRKRPAWPVSMWSQGQVMWKCSESM